jgi:hypothetical protein
MTKLLESKPRKQAQKPRTIGWAVHPGPDGDGVIRITQGQTVDLYSFQTLSVQQAPEGTHGYRLIKLGERANGQSYDVLLDLVGNFHECDCLGHLRWSHRTVCKHVAGLLKLIFNRLPCPIRAI